MATNRLRITHQSETIQLSWQRRYENPRLAPAVPFQQPFDAENAAELRWYLEDYLKFPYGIFPGNAAKIEQKLQQWGQDLFELVFRSSEKAREFFQEATREGLDNCELGIISDKAEVLNLPWELLYSPDYQFLAPSLAGMYRSLSSQAVKAPLPPMPDDQLNILLVIARPDDEQDVGFKTIARPLLAALQPIRQRVNLKVLRPPSLKAFEAELQANKGFYHIVHFDGHGNFDNNTQGVLVFEDELGNEQVVSAREIAQYLTDCRVPIFVLNACKSGQVGEEAFSSVAGQLVKLGAKGVVAMAYSVYAKGAEHFIGRLYGELVRGECIAAAVAAGRKSMSIEKLRPSPKGNLPLQDWLVPILYQQEPYTPFVPKKTAPSFADLMAQADNTPQSSKAVDLPDESAYGFIGRDYEILRLERAFRQNHVVLVQGMGGVGKTELVAGFARWLDDTQGREHIFFTSFEQGAGLSQVINQIGRALGGERFSQMMPEQQEGVVRQYLQTHRCLLIWDNFEPVNGFPTGNEPLVSGEERNKLKRFLKELRGGKSWVLITSRREEPWLDCGYSLINLRGLSQADAQELAAKILQTVGVERKNLPAEYLELLKLLGGHPLSLRVVLPHLKTQTPVQLIEALRRGLDTFEGEEDEDKDKSLTISLDYSFGKLSEKTRRHLPFLGFFYERIDAITLNMCSEALSNQFRQKYQALFGEILKESNWIKILDEGVQAGILENWNHDLIQLAPSLLMTFVNNGSNSYKIHPTLPWYFRQILSKHHSPAMIRDLEKAIIEFYAFFAATISENLIGENSHYLYNVLLFEEPNILQSLHNAEHYKDWHSIQFLLQALSEIYIRQSRKDEWKSLQRRIRSQIGLKLSEAKSKGNDAVSLWIYLRSADAREISDYTKTAKFSAICQEILSELEELKDTLTDAKIAGLYVSLGIAAQRQGIFEQAKEYYYTALPIFESDEDFPEVSRIYHQLGNLAFFQNNYQEAKEYYQKSLAIRENSHDGRAANNYYQLGLIESNKANLEQAKEYFNKAFNIYIKQVNIKQIPAVLINLGDIAAQEGNQISSISYYKQALQIAEDMEGADYLTAVILYNLGSLSWKNKNYEESANYCKKSFHIAEKLENWDLASQALTSWGHALVEEGHLTEALKLYFQALMIDIDADDEKLDAQLNVISQVSMKFGEDQFMKTFWQLLSEDDSGEVYLAMRLLTKKRYVNDFKLKNIKNIKPLIDNIITLIKQKNPERLDAVFDTFGHTVSFNKSITQALRLELENDHDSLAWFCSYVSSEINSKADNNNLNPSMNMVKLLLDNEFKIFEDFIPGNDFPGRILIVNDKKFNQLPSHVKQKLEQDFNISQHMIDNDG
ncbi:tetratricopeptide repeat protein [Nostoc sp. CENA67]|uniref:Tetratricopeptide repeat protein n=2 Tax=Amazonocrinis TaxID=2840440 RepID=A0A8J7HUB4_9NOST|nr:tetratricopeptide repeat protein [Amazonocrinis nigriterrae CENA67]